MSIGDIAQLNRFTSRMGGKITPMNFVISFFLSIQRDKHNFGTWAAELGLLIRQTISYNGMKKAQNAARAKFAKSLLDVVLYFQATQAKHRKWKTALLAPFNRVFVEDSTCFSLPRCLHQFFPGSHSKTGLAATAKIQLRLELKSGTYSNLSLKHFRNNDQSFASHILKMLKKGDLVIRDLGYSVLDVFKRIDQLNAFFISRLRYGTKLYDCQTKEEINLAKQLRKATRNKQTVVELFVLAGKKTQLKTRVCAIKCPAAVAQRRRRAAKKNKNQRANHSKEYFELLGWTIFITNVSEETLSAPQLLKVYGYRWRIEIIFKAWKTHFNLDRLFNTQATLNKDQVQVAVYLFLAWIILFFARMYNYYLYLIYTRKKKILSLMKFAKFVKEHITELLLNPDEKFWVDYIAYYCCYKKRYDRLNFCEQVYLIS